MILDYSVVDHFHVYTSPHAISGVLDWLSICRASSKVITFIDLAGHEKYLKTTIFGMTGHAPDFCMLMVGANAGVIGMTKGGLYKVVMEKYEMIRLYVLPCYHCC